MALLEAGPADGPLMVFVHGWPARGLVWRAQVAHFAAAGWHCVAPDLRGYGDAPKPAETRAYAVEHVVADLVALHDSLGGRPAVWVGHDWGAPVVWAIAGHHPGRCRGVAALCVPYLPGGFGLDALLPLVDRDLYPADEFPYGQWDYYRFYAESFDQATADFEADVAATVALLFRRGRPGSVGKRARSAGVRVNGGWFGAAHRAPPLPRDESMLSPQDFDELVAGLTAGGFRGPGNYYLNDAANLAYAATVPRGGRLELPVLFIHAAWDGICETLRSSLADPMRAACPDLTEETVDAGHELVLESPLEVNAALESWLDARHLKA